jgi:hypothetical protein
MATDDDMLEALEVKIVDLCQYRKVMLQRQRRGSWPPISSRLPFKLARQEEYAVSALERATQSLQWARRLRDWLKEAGALVP